MFREIKKDESGKKVQREASSFLTSYSFSTSLSSFFFLLFFHHILILLFLLLPLRFLHKCVTHFHGKPSRSNVNVRFSLRYPETASANL